MDKTYKNSTDGVLASRNPRLNLQPGDTLMVTPEMMSYSIRMWIRNGSLLLDEAEAAAVEPEVVKVEAAEPVEVEAAEPVEKPAPKAAAKPAAKAPVKTATKKPAAKKPAAAKK